MAARRDDIPNIVLGNPAPFFSEDMNIEEGQKFLDVFKSYGYFDIDTARAYEASEKNFGKIQPQNQGFKIDTKVASFTPGAHQPDNIRSSISQSFDLLKVNKVHILYLHGPERTTPFVDTLRTMNEEYKKGKFEKLGLSNYTAAEVAEIVSICDKNGFVRPSVYQGNYSILVRKGEDELFPLLKKERIAFYAWAPLAGGLLTGKNFTIADITANTARFSHQSVGPVYLSFFGKEALLEIAKEFSEFVKGFDIAPSQAALRWLAFHSRLSKADGDAIILGASRPEQFENNLKDLQGGPLPLPLVEFIDKLWVKVKDNSPSYHF